MARGKRRRLLIIALGFCLLAGLAFGLQYAAGVASIGVAYKARMVCSGVFVSHRDPRAVVAALEVDDVTMLQYVAVSVDREARSVTASVFGAIPRRAVYREGQGCALVFRDAATLPADITTRTPSAAVRSPAVLPSLASPADGTSSELLRAAIDRAFTEPNPLRPRRTWAVVIVHKGRIVAERYAAEVLPDTPLLGWSMSKSIMNGLVGVLVKEGRVAIDQPVPVAEWRTPGDPRSHITLDHLLRMSSGLTFDEDMTNPRAGVMCMLFDVGDMASYAANEPLEAAPGSRWRYSSGTTNIIARIIRDVLHDDREYLTFPRRALFDRIGMSGALLETDQAGTFVGSSFMYATARDWARFGMLYLQDGLWNGERILPEGWVAYTRSPAPADSSKRYGAHFWLDVPDDYRASNATLPPDTFHAAGHEGQFVTIVPSRDAVIVRLGKTRYPDAWDQTAFVRDVLDALGPGGA